MALIVNRGFQSLVQHFEVNRMDRAQSTKIKAFIPLNLRDLRALRGKKAFAL